MNYFFSPHSPQSPHFLRKFTAFTAFLTKIHPKTSTRGRVRQRMWFSQMYANRNTGDFFRQWNLNKIDMTITINCYPSETKLDTPCQDMQDLDSLDKTWIILPRS